MPVAYWGSEFTASAASSFTQDRAALAALADGGFAIVWQTGATGDRTIGGETFSATGGKEQSISLPTTPGTDLSPAITGLSGGGFTVAWTTLAGGSDYNVVSQSFTATAGLDGTVQTWFHAASSSTLAETSPSLAPAQLGGGFSIVWADSSGSITQEGNGSFFTNQFAGSTVSEIDSAVQEQSSMLSTFVLRTGSTKAIYAGAFGSFHQINQSTGVDVDKPSIDVLAGHINTYLVAWGEQDGASGYDIHFTKVDGGGDAVGTEGIANTTLAGDQERPDVVATQDGGFFIVWQGRSSDGSWDVYGQLFDSTGAKSGAEFTVNTAAAGDQINPTAALLSDGRIVVSWTDQADPDTANIHAQIVDPRNGLINGDANANTLYGNFSADQINGFGADDHLIGLAGADTLNGADGNDTLDGGPGADQMSGGTGNDLYIVDDSGDQIVEQDGGGRDKIQLHASGYVMADWVENMQLKGATASASGNAIGDHIVADRHDCEIWGMGGDDTIVGSDGADTLHGGAGADRLSGNNGADTFAFDAVGDSTVAVRDLILDLNPGQGDRIDLGAIDADSTSAGDQAFHYIGKHVFTHTAGELAAHYNAGTDITVLSGDVDGDGTADFQVGLKGDLTGVLSDGSFVL